jgi:hypothetical protein
MPRRERLGIRSLKRMEECLVCGAVATKRAIPPIARRPSFPDLPPRIPPVPLCRACHTKLRRSARPPWVIVIASAVALPILVVCLPLLHFFWFIFVVFALIGLAAMCRRSALFRRGTMPPLLVTGAAGQTLDFEYPGQVVISTQAPSSAASYRQVPEEDTQAPASRAPAEADPVFWVRLLPAMVASTVLSAGQWDHRNPRFVLDNPLHRPSVVVIDGRETITLGARTRHEARYHIGWHSFLIDGRKTPAIWLEADGLLSTDLNAFYGFRGETERVRGPWVSSLSPEQLWDMPCR